MAYSEHKKKIYKQHYDNNKQELLARNKKWAEDNFEKYILNNFKRRPDLNDLWIPDDNH